MASSWNENDPFSALRLFRGWPHPVVKCPECDDVTMRAVAVRVVHGSRETLIDAVGARAQPPSTLCRGGAHGFELLVTFQCPAHESTLRIAPDDRESDEQQCLSALVEVERLQRVRPPIGGEIQAKATKRPRPSALQLIRPGTRR